MVLAASLQAGANTLVYSPPSLHWPVWQSSMAEVMAYHSWDCCDRHCGSVLDAFVLFDDFPVGEADFHVMSSPGRYSCGEELRPLANSVWQPQACQEWWVSILETYPSTLSGLRMMSVPADILAAASPETLSERGTQLSCSWTPDPQKLCEIIKVHYFELLGVGVIW